jgi:class 3 adenylate cyclase/tetratricopeptide (TPR) repeat protein
MDRVSKTGQDPLQDCSKNLLRREPAFVGFVVMEERSRLEEAIAALEAQRSVLGDSVTETALLPLRARLAELTESEVRKLVTVLFADVRGYSTLSERLDPEDIADVMASVWDPVNRVVAEHGGRVDKHIGDAVMVLFGTPVAREDDPERAIRAALALQRVLSDSEADGVPLQMRIGINTGWVVLGTLRSTVRFTAMGHTVNVAQRLEEAAPPGGILVSHDAYRHVRGVFDVEVVPPIEVRGLTDPVRAYVVKAAKPRPFHIVSRGVAGIETPMVGRGAELAHLEEAFTSISLDRPRAMMVSVIGEAGVGKSRLLAEFAGWLDLLPERVWLFAGRAAEGDQATPFRLTRNAITNRFGIRSSDSLAVTRVKLADGFGEAMGAAWPELPFVGHLLGFDFSDDPRLAGHQDDASQIRRRGLAGIRLFLARGHRGRRTVLLLEDVHWADDASLDQIKGLVSGGEGLPLLVVCLARPSLLERRPPLADLPDATRLDLGPLSREDSEELVSHILRLASDPPRELISRVAEQAEGNPFHIEETVKMLIDDGVVQVGPGVWEIDAGRMTEIRVPDTLTALVQARLDQLTLEERSTLQRASVAGRIFWEGLLQWLEQVEADLPVPLDLAAVLDQLRGRELIECRPSSTFEGTDEYVFRHALVRDVAYRGMVRRVRHAYHGAVAGWLIDRSGDRAPELAGSIGQHLELGGDTAGASEWLVRAASGALAAYALDDAVDANRRSLEMAPPNAAWRVDALEGLGLVANWRGNHEEAASWFGAMAAAADALGDRGALARARNWLAVAHTYGGALRQALDDATAAAEDAQSAENPVEMIRSLWLRGWAVLRLGDAVAAEDLAGQALELAEQHQDLDGRAKASNLLGVAELMLDRYAPARSHLEKALAIFQEIGRDDLVSPILNNIGLIDEWRGDDGAALGRYLEAVLLARQFDNADGEIVFLSNAAGARVRLGDHEAAIAELERVIEMANEEADVLPETYTHLAGARLGLGDHDGALEAGRRAMALARASEVPAYLGAAWRVLGRIASTKGTSVDVESRNWFAAELFDESIATYQAAGLASERGRALRDWARHELANGNVNLGMEKWEEAHELFSSIGCDLEVENMRDELAAQSTARASIVEPVDPFPQNT